MTWESVRVDDSIPHLLIIAANPPGDGSVNEILLRDFCLLYPGRALSCFAIVNPGVTVALDWAPSHELSWMPVAVHRWVHKLVYFRLPRALVPLARIVAGLQTRAVQLPRLRRLALEYAREQRADAIWAVLNSPVVYDVARFVAHELELPLYASVWDPADRLVIDFRLDPLSRARAMKSFDHCVRRARAVAVISEGMRDIYRERYGRETIVLRHGVSRDAIQPPVPHMHSDGRLHIGFAGSTYTPDQWALLLSALERCNWRVAGRDVTIRLFGVHGHKVGVDNPHIENLGWLPVEDVIKALAQTDVLYLPYRFDPEHEASVRMAFPTKLSTYFATGRPVLYHGPYDSTPRRFFERFPAASCCHSMEESDLLAALTRLADDAGFYRECVEAGARAVAEELGYATTRRRFAEFIGIPEQRLRS